MRVFVDVGAHYGETLDVALDPQWGFGRVFSLEPSTRCLALLRGFRDPRLVVDPSGLSNRDGAVTLHGAGLLGGSVYADKPQNYGGGGSETITLVRASTWLREHTDPGDEVWLKLNCEGSEADVLDDLLGSDEAARVQSIYVDFDIRKIPSQAHRQDDLEQRLAASGITTVTPESLGAKGNDGVRAWLEMAAEPVDASAAARARHKLRLYLPPYLRVKAAARAVLPRQAFYWLGRRVGRQSRTA